MVKIGHKIPDLLFAAPPGTPVGVQVMSLTKLAGRVAPERLARPQRPAFHQLITVTGGSLRQTVDFHPYVVEPGAWLWIRPGQVQQWGSLTGVTGDLVLFQPSHLDAATASRVQLDDPYLPVLRQTDDAAGVRMALDHLAYEFGALGRMPLESHTAALRHLLAVLVLRLTYLAVPVIDHAATPDAAYLRFRSAVDSDFMRTRRVEDYARSLGYSTKTLARATQAAAGVSAKEFIDRRVVLEAKRLLAHSDQSAVQISQQLGFRAPTQFAKYFAQRTGQTPMAFRSAVAGQG
ncbi:AraC family transcriptional regulator [Kribbella antibiotica]|uniref:AraC family transcriptional regulator n=1 Tax=Kribbella antibiotica TaxID=190195 RepID=A0A4R4ZXU0_9ACTN|nr:AraC family transcriptional regulator [Kribbella antibiotica]TDD62999.1 AraC family transcriptional regulator [Kribbella antibiotica]